MGRRDHRGGRLAIGRPVGGRLDHPAQDALCVSAEAPRLAVVSAETAGPVGSGHEVPSELTREHDVVFELGRRVGTPAIDLDESLIGGLERACGQVGLNSVRMPTVGHDAAMFQRRGIPAAVVLVRNANGSHNPAEHMEMSDFAAGTKVLAAHILGRCQEEP